MTVQQFHIGLTSLVNSLQFTYRIVLSAKNDDTTTDGGNLTSTEETVTYISAHHLHVCHIHTTVVDITSSEDTTGVFQAVSTITRPSFVVNFLFIAFIDFRFRIIGIVREITIADITIEKCDV